MDAKLTYSSLLIFAACVVSSCTSDAPDDMDAAKGVEVSFAVSGLSRASVTTSFNQFAVYGDINHPNDDVRPPVVLFDNTEVNYKDDSWTYEGTQFWVPKYEHSFVAISPLSVLATDNTPRYLNSQLSFTYTIPTTDGGKLSSNSDVTDIIAATHRRLYVLKDDEFVTDARTKVTFKFGHLLSLINLSPALSDNIMKADDYLLFHKLELSGFKTKADFSILPAQRQSNSQTDDMVVGVDALDGTGSFTFDFTEPVKVLNNSKYVSLLAADDAIIMLPQAFGADSEAKIVLYYTINDDPEVKQLTLPLSSQTWDSGKSYIYRFIISRNGAHFNSTTITEWDGVDAGTVNAR